MWNKQPIGGRLKRILLLLISRKVSYSRHVEVPVCQTRHLDFIPPAGNDIKETGVWGNCHLSSLGGALASRRNVGEEAGSVSMATRLWTKGGGGWKKQIHDRGR